MANLAILPELVVQRICEFLAVVDYCRLRQTCRYLHAILPKLKDLTYVRDRCFGIDQPGNAGHYCPEIWIDGPGLPGRVKSMTVSMSWAYQGSENRKGQVWVQLMRGDEIIAEKTNIFGTAPHSWQDEEARIEGHNLTNLSKKGDFYRFMRNTGGNGVHWLLVRNFTVSLIWESLDFDEGVPLAKCYASCRLF